MRWKWGTIGDCRPLARNGLDAHGLSTFPWLQYRVAKQWLHDGAFRQREGAFDDRAGLVETKRA
jgi:hypothetical protein